MSKKIILRCLAIALVLAGTFIIVPQLDSLQSSLGVLESAQFTFVFAALATGLLASVISAAVYRQLAGPKTRLTHLIVVQFSGLFVNRIVPAGIGGIGLNIWYLRQRSFSNAQAGAIVLLNTSIGLIGHMVLLVVITGLIRPELQALQFEASISRQLSIGLLVLVAAGVFVYVLRSRLRASVMRLRAAAQHFIARFAKYQLQLVAIVGLSMMMTTALSLSFWLCCLALGIDITYAVAFMLFSFGVLVGSATPTPGGIGGFEAALFAGLVSQAYEPEVALAAALLFRLVTFWFGLLVGAVATIFLRRSFSQAL